MTNTILPREQKKVRPSFTIEGLIQIFNNIQSKIDIASGSATAIDLRLRAIGELEPRVQAVLKKHKKLPYYEANLSHLIDAVLEVFQDRLEPTEKTKIEACRPARNKIVHGSFAELMIVLTGKAPGREIDHRTLKT